MRPRRDRPALRKGLGQHHLRQGSLCRPLLDFLALTAGRHVVEIGPGGGVLTRELVSAGARVLALELDLDWAFHLRSAFRDASDSDSRSGGWPGPGSPNGEQLSVFPPAIAAADALDLPWRKVPADWRVAGNLPYSVGTAIVERMLRGGPAGLRAGFLLQREVVDRMTAEGGTRACGALTIRVAARARAVRLGAVRAGSFVPPPKVESAFVGLELRPPPFAPEVAPAFERVVGAGFGQRRKTLRNALSTGLGAELAAHVLDRAQVDPRRRAEELVLGDWVRLAEALAVSR